MTYNIETEAVPCKAWLHKDEYGFFDLNCHKNLVRLRGMGYIRDDTKKIVYLRKFYSESIDKPRSKRQWRQFVARNVGEWMYELLHARV